MATCMVCSKEIEAGRLVCQDHGGGGERVPAIVPALIPGLPHQYEHDDDAEEEEE